MHVGDVIKEINSVSLENKKPDEGGCGRCAVDVAGVQ